MQKIDTQLAEKIFTELKINKNLRRRMSLTTLGDIANEQWGYYEILALPTKDEMAGILLIGLHDQLYAIPYEIGRVTDVATGRSKPIICDFCKTWQSGARAGRIVFRPQRRSLDSVSLLCCADLQCSLHVRSLTKASKMSRAQLREDITPEQRIERLCENLESLVDRLALEPLHTAA